MNKKMIEEKLLNNLIKSPNQGYALYFKSKDILIEKYNGILKDDSKQLINKKTNFRLASVTKQFVAMAIITLIKNNELSFDDDVFCIFSDLPSYFKNITIKNLLNHTSGIYDYEDIKHSDNDKQIVDEEVLSFLKTTSTTYFKPGEKYQYSNTGYILLGLIVEKISKMPLGKYLKKYIFTPLKMKNTILNYQGITKIKNRAYGHILKNDELIVKDQYWASATRADGGIYSSVNDLKKWIKYLNNNYNDLKEYMFTKNILPDGSDTFYASGIRIIDVNNLNLNYHCGDTIGTSTFIMFSDNFDLECIFLTNINGIDCDIMKDNIKSLLSEF